MTEFKLGDGVRIVIDGETTVAGRLMGATRTGPQLYDVEIHIGGAVTRWNYLPAENVVKAG